MSSAPNEITQVELNDARQQPRIQPVRPIQSQDFTFGTSWAFRLFFVDVFRMMRLLYRRQTDYISEDCPSFKQEELFDHRNRQFQNDIIDLAGESKEHIGDQQSKAVLLLLKPFKKQICLLTLLLIIEMISRCSIPFVIQGLLAMEKGQTSWLLAILIIVLILGVILRHNNWKYGQQINTRIRVCLVKALYKKLMRLSTSCLRSLETSRIISHMTNDLNSIELKLQYFFLAFTAPFTLTYSLVMLIKWNGQEGLIGFVYFTSMFIVHIIINNRVVPLTVQRTKLFEQRMKIIKESIDGLRVIKVYTWQQLFYNMAETIRNKECRVILYRYFLLIIQRTLSLSSSAISSILVFLASYFMQGSLTVANVFATLQLFILMRFNVMFFTQSGIDHYFELKEIFGRYLTIMQIPENRMLNERNQHPGIPSEESPYDVTLSNVSVGWKQQEPILQDVSIRIQKGKKYCMSGKVGSGKSTFLQFLLKQAQWYRGYAEITQSISCSEQSPLILSGTIKDNILFGRKYDELRYKQAIHTACLDQDFILLDKSDETEIQEGGQNLSGGQKSRINLARCLYQDCSMYILDDPFAACDEKVSRAILSRMFSGMLRYKTVLVLSSPKFISRFDYLLHISNRTIIVSDSERMQIPIEQPIQQKPKQEPSAKKIKLKPVSLSSSQIYISYAREAGNWIHWIIVLILFTACEVSYSYYIRDLSQLGSQVSSETWGRVCALSFSLIFLYLFKYLYLIFVLGLANKKLSNRLYNRILYGRMGFFELADRADLISKLSNDMTILDNSIPMIMCDAIESPMYFLNMVIVIGVKVPQWAITIPFLLATIVIIYKLSSGILNKSKTLDLKTRAPLIRHFMALLRGSSQIRCFGQENTQFYLMKEALHRYFRINLFNNLLQRGFGFFIQSGTLIFSILGIVLTYLYSWDLQSGQQLIFCIALSDYIQFGIRQISTLDSLMASVGRVLALQQIQIEKDVEEPQEVPTGWPSKGQIVFQNVSMSYENGKQALNNVSFQIKSGTKVGCVGRTGAGKSSILNALFAFEPISNGCITIDGIDIRHIRLERLRSAFGVIPQNPFILSGSLKKNVDPFDEFTNYDIRETMCKVQLQKYVEMLQQPVSNFSQGQKQLICLCRCLLRRPSILVLDEASAWIDTKTEELVHAVVDKQFSGRTVLAIAHKTNTLSNCSMIIEMKEGHAKIRQSLLEP